MIAENGRVATAPAAASVHPPHPTANPHRHCTCQAFTDKTTCKFMPRKHLCASTPQVHSHRSPSKHKSHAPRSKADLLLLCGGLQRALQRLLLHAHAQINLALLLQLQHLRRQSKRLCVKHSRLRDTGGGKVLGRRHSKQAAKATSKLTPAWPVRKSLHTMVGQEQASSPP